VSRLKDYELRDFQYIYVLYAKFSFCVIRCDCNLKLQIRKNKGIKMNIWKWKPYIHDPKNRFENSDRGRINKSYL